jgi:xylulokinase
VSTEAYIGVDLGTTAVKVGLFDTNGIPLAVATREFALNTPAPGWVEFDADSYLETAFDGIRSVVAGSSSARVRAIGLSSQGQTFVLLGEDDRPLRPAISWLDVRAEEQARALSEISPTNAIATAPKLFWVREHEPAVLRRTRQVQLIPDCMILRLTGRTATDPATAQSTGMYDWHKCDWDSRVTERCGIDASMLPPVLCPGASAGHVSADAAQRLGLPADALVAIGTNDQLAGALGAGNVLPGCVSATFGTALAIIATSPRGTNLPGVEVAPHPVQGLYALLAYAKTAGIVLRWFRDNFAPTLSYDDLMHEAAGAPIGSDGLTAFPHFSGMATPTFDPAARGAFAGLTLSHTRAHMTRAIVESLAFTVRENLDLLAPAIGGVRELRAIGGGAQSDFWMQMVADVTGVPVGIPAAREAACLGSAELAMVAAGRFPSVADASQRLYRADRRFVPQSANADAYNKALHRYRTLQMSLRVRR